MKKVLLVGHCGPDSSYLRMAVKSALGEVAMLAAHDNVELEHALAQGVDLILMNRELGYGLEPDSGVEMIRLLRSRPGMPRMMLVSNHPEAQAEAVAAGALPGFGKRQIGSKQATQALQNAFAAQAPTPPAVPSP